MKTSCRFELGFWDINAAADGRFAVSTSQSFANPQDANREDAPAGVPLVATSDWRVGWPLDGSRAPIPDNAPSLAWGWWSAEQCGDDCAFAIPPKLTAAFVNSEGAATLHSSVGITLVFAGVLPKQVNIRWFSASGIVLANGTFYPDAEMFFCEKPVENYTKVEITVPSMQWPRCFLRVSHVVFGALSSMGGDEVLSATLTEEVSPVGDTLPIDKLAVSFYTANGDFALLNPQGRYQFFQYRQRLTAFQTINGIERKRGDYFLRQAEATVDAVTKLDCVNIIGLLDSEQYSGGYYEDELVYDLVAALLEPLGIAFEIAPEIALKKLSGWLPAGSVRTALQHLVFAAGAVLFTAGGGSIRLLAEAPALPQAIAPARKVVGHKVTLDELITGVSVTSYTYKKETATSELWRGELDVGEHDIFFTSPAEAKSASGAALLSVADTLNRCHVRVDTAGEVTISGYAYKATEREHTASISSLPVGTREKIKSFSGVTILTPEAAEAKAAALCDYYQRRYVDEGVILPGAEFSGAQAEIQSLSGKSISGQIERLVTDLTGGGLQTVKIVGKTK